MSALEGDAGRHTGKRSRRPSIPLTSYTLPDTHFFSRHDLKMFLPKSIVVIHSRNALPSPPQKRDKPLWAVRTLPIRSGEMSFKTSTLWPNEGPSPDTQFAMDRKKGRAIFLRTLIWKRREQKRRNVLVLSVFHTGQAAARTSGGVSQST